MVQECIQRVDGRYTPSVAHILAFGDLYYTPVCIVDTIHIFTHGGTRTEHGELNANRAIIVLQKNASKMPQTFNLRADTTCSNKLSQH